MPSKQNLRKLAYQRRREYTDRKAASRIILSRVLSSEVFRTARRVLIYLSVRSEVETIEAVRSLIGGTQSIHIPVCRADDLQLFQLRSMEELQPRSFGILEPSDQFDSVAERWTAIDQVDLAIVPGVAFDRTGVRLGNGRGFFDRLFANSNDTPLRVGIAFECQIWDSLPSGPQDVAMHAVVTESTVYGPRADLFA